MSAPGVWETQHCSGMGGDFRLLLLLSLLLKSWRGHGLRVNGPWKYQGCCSLPIEPLEPPKRSSMTASKGQPELPPEKPDPQNTFPPDASQAAFAPDIPSPGASVALLHRPITYIAICETVACQWLVGMVPSKQNPPPPLKGSEPKRVFTAG